MTTPSEFPPPPPQANVSPRRRIWRTAVQATLAGLVATPLAVAELPLDSGDAALAVGISSALTILVSAVWNVIDARASRVS
jgi:hypothetical protein